MLLRDVDLRIGRQSGSAANSNEKRKFHSREIDDPRPLLQQRADCLSRIYGSTMVGAKVTALSFCWSTRAFPLRKTVAIRTSRTRARSQTFIASCENDALCYVRVSISTFTCNA